MSGIPEALKKVRVQQDLGVEARAEKVGRPQVLPEDLLDLADSLQEGTRVGCRRERWDLQESIVTRGHSKDRIIAVEELRKLCAWLLQRQRATSQKTLLVTSGMPKEGKTFLATNLAWIMAQSKNQKVLLIDADLRSPSAHLMLGAPSVPGLAEFLEGKAEESQILQQGPLSNFFFIPSGQCPENPVELLTTTVLRKLIARLSAQFDWIVVDSSPVASICDAQLIAPFMDGILLVIGAGASSAEFAVRARDLLTDMGLLGVILNYVDPRETYSSYYYRAYMGKRPKE
jgi:capsular exopolysaccharide synthesis family protein